MGSKKSNVFRFKPFSKKQQMLLSWWREGSPYSHYDTVIADGAIRSGKTISMICSFMQFSQSRFSGEAFIIAGKSIGALKRNVVTPMLRILTAWGWPYTYNRGANSIEVGTNTYFLFGANTESSQDTLQGLTAAGAFADEVALMPRSFVEQMIGRCSIDGAKIFMNCNPKGPVHWFYKDFILEAKSKHIFYLHFVMSDNLTLSEGRKALYRRMFTGVFYKRYVLGLWVQADGAIYNMFAEDPKKYITETPKFDIIQVGIDFGGSKSAFAFVASGIKQDGSALTALVSERHPAAGIDPDKMYRLIQKFLERVEKSYGEIERIYADSAEQTLINGLRSRVNVPVNNSIKNPINDRIHAATSLIAQDKFTYTADCASLVEALSTAVYDEKQLEDTRLDNGTSDIDSLDAWEYSWERYIKRYVMM